MEGKSVNEKAQEIMNILRNKVVTYFPQKHRNISTDNQLFFTDKLARMKRKKQREYNKNRKSNRWKSMELDYKLQLDKAKKNSNIKMREPN